MPVFPRPYGSPHSRSLTLINLLKGPFHNIAEGRVLLLGCSLGALPQYINNLTNVTEIVTVIVPINKTKPDIDLDLKGMDVRSFDLILVMDYFEDIHWGPWSLQLLQHIIKPGGHLICTFANPLGVSYYLRRIKEKLLRATPTPDRRKITTHFYDSFPSFDSINAMFIKLGYIPLYRATRLSLFGGTFSFFFKLIEKLSLQGMKIWRDWGQQGVFVCRTPKDSHEEFPLAFSDNLDMVTAKHAEHFFREYLQLNEWLDTFPSFKLNTELSRPHQVQSITEPITNADSFVLSPHPDDELIGCGGMLLQQIKKGQQCTILQLTDGGAAAALHGVAGSVQRTIRFDEAKLVADSIKAELHCWPIAGSTLACTNESVAKLSSLLQARPYSHIFVPFINDSHPDHVIANHILAKALAQNPNILAPGANIYCYEVWSLAPANYICPIDEEMEEKCDLLMHYSTGMKAVNYIYHSKLNAAYHATKFQNANNYAEAFLKLEPTAYQQLVEAHISIGDLN
ncbi:MAG: PIG-L family deacetylase [Magnetococcales bacterium]|nr:PIG-L family deacetylase [Magnetococcales bacterium]